MDTQELLSRYTAETESAMPNAKRATARDAALYLAHTERGESIRELARVTGMHPSTISRAVRRVEQSRDDPLIDRILEQVERKSAIPLKPANCNRTPRKTIPDEHLRAEAKKFLRRLSEPGAFLLIAQGTEKAGVFCAANGHARPIALVPVDLAAEFRRQDWIRPTTRGDSSIRYCITDVGRSYVRRAVAEDRPQVAGFAEAQTPFQSQHQERGERIFADPETGAAQKISINAGECPVGWLAKRKGPDGKPFLTPEEVEAADLLRRDFEAAQIGPQVTQNWQSFLTPIDPGTSTGGNAGGSGPARERVAAALGFIGPGLADVALRTCCFLEGLEACERRMGWSSRSGKVVLKIALQRLADHYGLAVFKD